MHRGRPRLAPRTERRRSPTGVPEGPAHRAGARGPHRSHRGCDVRHLRVLEPQPRRQRRRGVARNAPEAAQARPLRQRPRGRASQIHRRRRADRVAVLK